MIYSEITGRCGNQFFQYAFARKLSILHGNMPMHLNFFNVTRWREKTKDDTFSDQLKYFQVVPYESSGEKLDFVGRFGSVKQKLRLKQYFFLRKVSVKLHMPFILRSALHELNRQGIYREDEYPDCLLTHTSQGNMFAKGYFEDPRYFDDIKEQLQKEFTPKFPVKEQNRELYEKICSSESVCVTFRSWGEVSQEVKAERDVCGSEYYAKAIEKMHELHPNALFVIFSDDVGWVRENFAFPYETVFESGKDEIWEKLRLMYSCKHFIMTTSTFAWWAQYLCRNPKKTVIGPDRWYQTDKKSYLMDKKWLTVEETWS